jgi:hypothetical protein
VWSERCERFPTHFGIVRVDQLDFRMPSDCDIRAVGQLVIYPCFNVQGNIIKGCQMRASSLKAFRHRAFRHRTESCINNEIPYLNLLKPNYFLLFEVIMIV